MADLTNNIASATGGEYATRTYKLNFATNRISGMIDGKEAVLQAVVKIMSTERYAYVIYSSQYGVELEALIGRDIGLVKADLQRRIEEALLVDDRILSISNFIISQQNVDTLTVEFLVNTVYGQIQISTGVVV